jgi:hypothetical protein
MSERRVHAAIFLACAALLCSTACQTPAASPPAAAAGPSGAPASAPAAAPSSAMPHGDHNPHHGGVVMMKGELHYEVVLDPTGHAHQLYFSDASRVDLPASVASTAALTIRRPDGPDEPIPLQIDESGESWIGSGRPVSDTAKTTVRVAFTIGNEPYWIDLPFK